VPKKFVRATKNGVTFVFKMDEVNPEILHIYARHLTTIDDAVGVFFDDSNPVWNITYERYENYNDTHGLYWFWLDKPNRVVMVVTCFRNEG
jgi:hypothetical protein